MKKQNKIFVAGHNGLVGSAIVRKLTDAGQRNIVTRTRRELDLTEQEAVRRFFRSENIDQVYIAAARVGGIHANSEYPADFIYDNLMIACNIIRASYENKVKKLLFLGSSCIYPKFCPQPMKEEHLLTGILESTNEAYAVAKIAGLKLCKYFRNQYGCDFISAMPTNLYGPNDNFHPMNSHVLPALIRRFHEAKIEDSDEVVVWGTGRAVREMLHVDDLAAGLLLLMDRYSSDEIINIGTGHGYSILELAGFVADAIGFKGRIVFDPRRPDGTPIKILANQKIVDLGWKPTISLAEGIRSTYAWALENGVLSSTRDPRISKPTYSESTAHI